MAAARRTFSDGSAGALKLHSNEDRRNEGKWFFEQTQTSTQTDNQSMKLYTAVADLTWLVERLIEHCANPAWVQQAQIKLKQIKQEFGN